MDLKELRTTVESIARRDAAHRAEADEADGENEKGKPTQAELLVALADPATLFHTPDGETGFASFPVDGHVETWPLRSKGFRRWIIRQFYETYTKPPGGQAVADALSQLEAKAHFNGEAQDVFVRIGNYQENIYLDLGDAQWRTVEITSENWKVIANPPVRFRRPKGMRPLPEPQRGGDLGSLRDFVNVGSEDDWRLYLAFVLAAFRPVGPYPLLIQHGEQGTAKTTNSKVARGLIDPNIGAVRAEPTDLRDVMVAANNGWCLAFDNLSHLPSWLSDALCRLATGGGFSTRELYSDQDETIFQAQRPAILNGIEELATRGDLLDRSIILYLPRISDTQRKPELAFWAAFETARPRLLGALLDVVVVGLRNLPDVHLDRHPRMADFARWVTACEPALGWKPGSFMESYTQNRAAANDLTLEASPIAGPVRDLALVVGDAGWRGTSGELLKKLNDTLPKDTKPPEGWPKTPKALSNALRRLAPSLLATGIEVVPPTDKTREAGTRKRILTIRTGRDSSVPIVPSVPTDGKSTLYPGTERGPIGTQAELFRPTVTAPKDKGGTDGDDGADKIPLRSNGWEEI